jgi:hypothetical protein
MKSTKRFLSLLASGLFLLTATTASAQLHQNSLYIENAATGNFAKIQTSLGGSQIITIPAVSAASDFIMAKPNATQTINNGITINGAAISLNATGNFGTTIGNSTGVLSLNSGDGLLLNVAGQASGTINVAGLNTSYGYQTLNANTGGNNTAFGHQALMTNVGNSYSTAVGSQALMLSTGANNTAVGGIAMPANTSGNNNVAVGTTAMLANTTGSNNVAIGSGALATTTNTDFSTAVGVGALATSNAINNTAVGAYALNSTTSGVRNTAFGVDALFGNTTGFNNTAVGENTLLANTTGDHNTAIGWGANVGGAALTNATAIGNGATVAASNTIQLGNASVTLVNTKGAVTAAGGSGNDVTIGTSGTNEISATDNTINTPSSLNINDKFVVDATTGFTGIGLNNPATLLANTAGNEAGTYGGIRPSSLSWAINEGNTGYAASITNLDAADAGAGGLLVKVYNTDPTTAALDVYSGAGPAALFDVMGDGSIVGTNWGVTSAGALTAAAGLTATAGGVTATAGDVTITAGGVKLGAAAAHTIDFTGAAAAAGNAITVTGQAGTGANAGGDISVTAGAGGAGASAGGGNITIAGGAKNGGTADGAVNIQTTTTGNTSIGNSTGSVTITNLVVSGAEVLSYHPQASVAVTTTLADGFSVYEVNAGAGATFDLVLPSAVNGQVIYIHNNSGFNTTASGANMVAIPAGESANLFYAGGTWHIININ